MTDSAELPLRSVLFTPATRPDRVVKLPETGADLGVVDLEDAVAPNAKTEARGLALRACAELASSAPGFAVAVRVNAPRSEHVASDLAEGVARSAAFVMVPKVETADDVRMVRSALDDQGMADVGIIAGIETGAGVLGCADIAASGLVTVLYFGAEDYISDIGGERTPEGREVLYARSHVALVARVHGLRALDQIVASYTDDDQFRRDAAAGRSLGYAGKLCIHPRQVALARQAFTPSPQAVERARHLVDTYEAALEAGVGVVTFDGQMVDQPMLQLARAVIRAAEHPSTDEEA
jgi:citrate lyase subunit beta / citryl-CoA lyase